MRAAGFLPRLLSALHTAGILTEDLSHSDEGPGALEGVYRGLCVCPARDASEEAASDVGAESRRVRRRIGRCSLLCFWVRIPGFPLSHRFCAAAHNVAHGRHPCCSVGEPRGGAHLLHGMWFFVSSICRDERDMHTCFTLQGDDIVSSTKLWESGTLNMDDDGTWV